MYKGTISTKKITATNTRIKAIKTVQHGIKIKNSLINGFIRYKTPLPYRNPFNAGLLSN